MTKFDRGEIQKAFEAYHQIRSRGDWVRLAEFFTDNATFHNAHWGEIQGREAISQFLHDSMVGLEEWTFPTVWFTFYENRVIVYFMNRLPGKRPDGSFFETPGVSVLTYAGNGLFSRQEDIINMIEFMKLVEEAGVSPPVDRY